MCHNHNGAPKAHVGETARSRVWKLNVKFIAFRVLFARPLQYVHCVLLEILATSIRSHAFLLVKYMKWERSWTKLYVPTRTAGHVHAFFQRLREVVILNRMPHSKFMAFHASSYTFSEGFS